MSGPTRRTVLQASVAAGLGGAVLGAGSGPARADSAGPAPELHRDAVLDARMSWQRLPEDHHDAPALGDGKLIAHVHRGPRDTLAFALVTAAGSRSQPSARLLLTLPGTPTGAHWELDLWNAELTGTVTTTGGDLRFSALVHRRRGVLLVRLTDGADRPGVDWTLEPGPHGGGDIVWQEHTAGSVRTLAAAGDEAAVRRALTADRAALDAEHRQWWNAHFGRGLIAVPDPRAQRFYWAQVYAAAALLDPDRAVTGIGHPLLGTTDHLDLDPVARGAQGLPSALAHHHVYGALPGTGSRGGRTANPVAAWGLPAVDSVHRLGMDRRILSEVLHPALRAAVRFWSGFLVEDHERRLHLPATHSPRYADAPDSSHDLALLRWSLRALLDATARLGLSDPEADRWRDVAARLTPYHRDASGVMVGAGVGLTRSHPYASHLAWLHPLREELSARGVDEATARHSYAHWTSMREDWYGSSSVAAAALAAALREPERALEHLTHFLDGASRGGPGSGTDAGAVGPNALYRPGVGEDPDAGVAVPLAAGQALLDLLLDGRSGTLEVFPAVPSGWSEAAFSGLRAHGAFLVDAARSGGRTDWVRVRSEAGEPLVLAHGIEGPVDVLDGEGRPRPWQDRGARRVAVALAAGESVLVTGRGAGPRAVTGGGTP
ncbi:glycoside hydrolase family 95-like protein [Kitasatospora sp. NPDC048545]|uniref:glycoside hydrolase family 95-like protein n=1 Tax=Kitasatospora sp. NPDC048545 TaxID=3157208 RepID=UPI0033FE82DB